MSAKKTAKPQTVTFYRPEMWWRPAAVMSESGSTSRTLEDIAIYDAAGVICWLDSCELGDTVKSNPVTVSLPIIWKTFRAPDFTETRAHIVVRDSFGERKYTLFIPCEAVTMDNGAFHYSSSRHTFSTTRYFAVKEFPRKFAAWAFHPFEQYKMVHEIEALQKEQYRILTGDDIITPYAQQRIAEFFAKLQEYTAEAQRLHDLTEEEFMQECGINGARYRWNDGSFYRIKDEEPEA